MRDTVAEMRGTMTSPTEEGGTGMVVATIEEGGADMVALTGKEARRMCFEQDRACNNGTKG